MKLVQVVVSSVLLSSQEACLLLTSTHPRLPTVIENMTPVLWRARVWTWHNIMASEEALLPSSSQSQPCVC